MTKFNPLAYLDEIEITICSVMLATLTCVERHQVKGETIFLLDNLQHTIDNVN
jgi:hypothetical protein